MNWVFTIHVSNITNGPAHVRQAGVIECDWFVKYGDCLQRIIVKQPREQYYKLFQHAHCHILIYSIRLASC